ncbi:hypothetical protein Dsin_021445 [Dipteronia sinensis]|uniref:Endonuclease/exonuclease/phosphatase domain-containing protein n=1 Tax=Dipteronia sinensis TaxID=43782 RepID=A0AAD9ZZP1_9ROSI|nr:hypothetical protein Dsin_021445 [Dipteronia sinensis]
MVAVDLEFQFLEGDGIWRMRWPKLSKKVKLSVILIFQILGRKEGGIRKEVIRGDFNTVVESWERKWGAGNVRSMRNFRQFIDLAKVVDLPMLGMSFTWSNNREIESWARLDRFLCDPRVLSWFPNLVQKGLSRSLSDHNPVCIGEQDVDWGPKPFRFSNVWMDDKALMEGFVIVGSFLMVWVLLGRSCFSN